MGLVQGRMAVDENKLLRYIRGRVYRATRCRHRGHGAEVSASIQPAQGGVATSQSKSQHRLQGPESCACGDQEETVANTRSRLSHFLAKRRRGYAFDFHSIYFFIL